MGKSRAIARERVEEVLRQFDLRGTLLVAEPYGSGHINDTLSLIVDQAGGPLRYILQRINKRIFKDPPRLMSNISRVTAWIAERLAAHLDASRRVLTVVSTRDGLPYALDAEGDYWRIYLFIEKARTYDVIDGPGQAASAARAFGAFMRQLEAFPARELHETIPEFHHTPARFAALVRAIEEDRCNRAAGAKAEIALLMEREADVHRLLALHREGRLPLRVTHNDCKLNNVMIDDMSGEGICVIDLDTVMPGLSLYDFGDMVRTATSPAAEDERDLARVRMQMPMFRALLEGFLSGAGAILTPEEIDQLPFAGKLITLETGIRFLTDHLNGDVYFKTARPGHNLDRCRTQCRLVASIEEQEAGMRREVARAMEQLQQAVDR
ncbi:MAG TPA: aminoglycoside phosphotransferase family protein [Kiritimatiellia bacterium]|nr:aminoglycoside phosphotransferase family protein [Kiritimatiellia bacterium]